MENQRLQEGIKENAKNRAKDNKSILDKYGFKYSSSGAITNAEKNLEKLRKKLSLIRKWKILLIFLLKKYIKLLVS